MTAERSTQTANDIVAFQETLLARGLSASSTSTAAIEPPLVPDLCDSPEPIQKLPLSEALRSALAQADLPTVRAVASLTRSELLELPGIGRKKLADVVEALHQFPAGETSRVLRETAGVSSKVIQEQLDLLLDEGIVVPCEVKKHTRTEPAYRLAGDGGTGGTCWDK